jgi:hypothetical protein
MRGASGVAPEKGFSAPLIEHVQGIEEASDYHFRSTHTQKTTPVISLRR